MPLFIVSTPIGNLEDITLRALRILRSVDFICAEDTRTASNLLRHYQMTTPMTSFHSYTGEKKRKQIIDQLKQGKSIALISEAGTPGISDPGWNMIHDAIEANISLVPIPGPSAFLAALVGSGLPTDKFLYLGFLPLKKRRQRLLKNLSQENRTIIFYESPQRIIRTLKQFIVFFPGTTTVVLARELTKIHEEFIRGTLESVLHDLKQRSSIKGEFVVLLKN